MDGGSESQERKFARQPKKSMRKYGKRPRADADLDKATTKKQQRLSASDHATPQFDQSMSKAHYSSPSKEPILVETEVKKGSILSFFQPIQVFQNTSETPSPKREPSMSPPPLHSAPKRVPRRLTTKPILSDPALPIKRDCTSSNTELRTTSRDSFESSIRPRPMRNARQTVQTTLNLSLQGDLTECHVCGMLYNSVHPKDVKLHAQRHTQVLKQRQAGSESTSPQGG